jgi:parvulin-like peptidyl-prolyl isomerase
MSIQASARHILVASEKECADLKQQIAGGADFAELAAKHSKCPSGKRGGELGTFGKGQMVKEFEDVVFTAPVSEVQGPVKTDFGYHLIEVTARSEPGKPLPPPPGLASARHILVKTEAECADLKQQITGGADFAELAAKHSKCPSGKRGGELGTFGKGQMVKEFETVVFSAPVGEVQGPVKTDFGYHLIEVTARS